MSIDTWARKWGVSQAAVADLMQQIGLSDNAPLVSVMGTGIGSEAHQQGLVRLEAASVGVWLTRNNVGVLLDTTGRPVRYGLANESKEQNKAVKSADLIGIRSVLIEQKHVGSVIGQFVSRECKREGWTYKGDAHEQAQLAWCNFVLSKGGDAAFCSGPGSFIKGVQK